MIFILIILLGITAGLRAGTPLAAVSIGAWLGWIDLGGTWAAFVGHIITVIVLVIIALLEFVGDQLPRTPSRKVPQQFGARIVSGAIAGMLLGLPYGSWLVGLLLGIVGAILGTLGGATARGWLAKTLGRDLPAGIIEDIVAVVLALLA